MRILIAYDGSSGADAALLDLQRAGLPQEAEALVVSVSDVWTVPEPSDTPSELCAKNPDVIGWKKARLKADRAIEAAREIAIRARKVIKANFPMWRVGAEAYGDSPAWAIIRRAESWGANLIIGGTYGHSALGRLFLGSTSQKVLYEARCSVRVARGQAGEDDSPVRIFVGTDGSPGAEAAVNVVAARNWPPGSETRVVAVYSPFTLLATHYLLHPVSVTSGDYPDEGALAQMIGDAAAEKLQAVGILASPIIKEGDPKQVLVDEAKEWGASSIFLGAKGLRGVERFLIGSVSASVAARAHCSVEVVRT
jgi:nucleotide-binding universal stress UspA family protein